MQNFRESEFQFHLVRLKAQIYNINTAPKKGFNSIWCD